MPKNTKRTKVTNLPRSKKELTTKAAKKVKGGLLPAIQPSQGTSLGTTVQKVKIGGSTKGGWDLGQLPGLQ